MNIAELQETAFGMNAKDVRESFLSEYVDWQIVENSPFDSYDEYGVGQIVSTAAAATKGMQAGIYGSIAAEKNAMKVCRLNGIGFMICKSETIPIACLSAAQSK